MLKKELFGSVMSGKEPAIEVQGSSDEEHGGWQADIRIGLKDEEVRSVGVADEGGLAARRYKYIGDLLLMEVCR